MFLFTCNGALYVALIAQAETLLPKSISILILATLNLISISHLTSVNQQWLPLSAAGQPT
jgi:hypothetical protein